MTISEETAKFMKENEVLDIDGTIYVRKDVALQVQVNFFNSLGFWKLIGYWWTAKRNPKKALEVSIMSVKYNDAQKVA